MTFPLAYPEIITKLRLGMTRDEVKAVLGEPTDWSLPTKKRRIPCIYKYGDIELHFGDGKDGTLFLVYSEDADLKPTIWMTTITHEQL